MTTIFTIGHSNQSSASFDALLRKQKIERLVDVRSKPYSRFRHFNREAIERRLKGLDISYLYLGDLLGGHPEADEFYVNGRVVYERIASKREFRRGIKRVIDESEKKRIALMCTEEDPAKCHRHPLLASALIERGVQVLHLRRDGTTQDAAAITEEASVQLPLVEPVGEDLTWQSPKRIRQRPHN